MECNLIHTKKDIIFITALHLSDAGRVTLSGRIPNVPETYTITGTNPDTEKFIVNLVGDGPQPPVVDSTTTTITTTTTEKATPPPEEDATSSDVTPSTQPRIPDPDTTTTTGAGRIFGCLLIATGILIAFI